MSLIRKSQLPFSKTYIRTLIERYIKQREWLYDNCKAFKTPEHLQAICRISNKFGIFQNSDLEAHCNMVLLLEPELRKILPGESSKFYCSRVKMIEKLFTDCKNYLDERRR